MSARLVTLSLLLVAGPASAQPIGSEGVRIHWGADTGVVLGSLIVAGLATRIAVDEKARWTRELFPFDEPVKRNYSPAAAHTSDLLLATTVVAPLALQFHTGFDRAGGARALIYGETLAVNLAMNSVMKSLVGRPRPYCYCDDPAARALMEGDPHEARLSFYSGHASTAFAAAVGGAYLFSQSSEDTAARTAVWASSLMLATATSNLRVRAGRHFYSDVLAGAVLGTGLGLMVPVLHHDGRPAHALAPAEWIAIGTAPLAGALVSQWVPFTQPVPHTQLLPWVAGSGGGVLLAGLF
jgi:membrane-associated phospholipid phosphatase